jgi:hypothetical protein
VGKVLHAATHLMLEDSIFPETMEDRCMPEGIAVESDFSPRKLKIAGVCLMGQLFGSSMLLVGPLSMLMMPMIQEFGWSRSQFSYATTAVM